MRVYRSNQLEGLTLRQGIRVTIFALGRGVNQDGSLTPEVQYRVQEVVKTAIALQERGHQVRIVWTGGASRIQVSKGQMPSEREAWAMFKYAQTLADFHRISDHQVEPDSTNTVENVAKSYKYILSGSVVIIMSDNLHFKWGRIAHIAKVGLVNHPFYLVSIGAQHKGPKAEATQLASLIALRVTMMGVKRGDPQAFLERQKVLNRIFMKRQLAG